MIWKEHRMFDVAVVGSDQLGDGSAISTHSSTTVFMNESNRR
jgi:hypothetical protein